MIYISIYCSWGIKKNINEKKLCWSEIERELIRKAISPYEPLFLDPNADVPNLDDAEAQFWRDMYQIKFADFVVVDARERRGIGIGVEMLAAKYFETPLIVVLPNNSHYKSDNVTYRGSTVKKYIHPHIYALADRIVDDFKDVGKALKEMYETKCTSGNMTKVDNAVQAYISRILPKDSHMNEILNF